MAVIKWVNHDDFPTVVVDDAIDVVVLRRMGRCEVCCRPSHYPVFVLLPDAMVPPCLTRYERKVSI